MKCFGAQFSLLFQSTQSERMYSLPSSGGELPRAGSHGHLASPTSPTNSMPGYPLSIGGRSPTSSSPYVTGYLPLSKLPGNSKDDEGKMI